MTTTLSDYADDIADVLEAGVAALTKGTNLFSGPMRARSIEGVPTKAVFVVASGGLSPINYLDNSHTPQLHRPSVQITVRGEAHDFYGGLTLSQDCYTTVHDKPPAGYVSVRSPQAFPVYLGENEHGEFLWTINLDIIKEET